MNTQRKEKVVAWNKAIDQKSNFVIKDGYFNFAIELNATPTNMITAIEDTLEELREDIDPFKIFGFTLDEIGARCGLLLMLCVIFWLLSFIVSWIVRFFTKPGYVCYRCCCGSSQGDQDDIDEI